MKQTLNIALLGRDFLWSGGAEFLRNLAHALFSIPYDREIRLFLLLPVRNKIDSLVDLRGFVGKAAATLIGRKKLPLLRKESAYETTFPDYFLNIDGSVEPVEYNMETGLVSALRRIQADVVMPSAASLGQSFPFPWVGYASDFQHKYLSEYFSARECLNRDIHFATMLRDAKAVIVNAKSVKDDIDKFFPYHNNKVLNLPFSASPASAWLDESDPHSLKRYNLPSRYFLISNQFWIHKSHITAFRALASLVNDKDLANLHIVCTGKMEDYRFPDHIRDLQQEVRELGIENRVRFLGHIPKSNQIAIMKKALAVLQPTLFEGGPGGGSVYDAVSLGIPAILTDIPVNREIENEENLFYFEAGSATDLAEKMKGFLKKSIKRPTKEELILVGAQRKKLMGKRLLEAAQYVMGETCYSGPQCK